MVKICGPGMAWEGDAKASRNYFPFCRELWPFLRRFLVDLITLQLPPHNLQRPSYPRAAEFI